MVAGRRSARLIALLAAVAVAVVAGAALDSRTAADAQSPPAEEGELCAELSGQTLDVVTKPVEPFVFTGPSGEDPSGFSIELWQLVAARLGIDTEWRTVETVPQLFEDLDSGEADVAIAAISITAERQESHDFSTPIFATGLRVMTRDSPDTDFGDTISVVASFLLPVAGVFFVILTVVGTVVWLLERRHNDDFPHGLAGIGEGMWWAVVTMATVGYGDRVTRTRWGRLFSALWILAGLVLVAQFTAAVTTKLTVEELSAAPKSLAELADDDVVTVESTAAAELLVSQRIPARLVGSIEEMVAAVADGDADAAVYDGSVLEYQATLDSALVVLGDALTLDYYGIALPQGSPATECVDRALIDLIEDGSWQRLHDAWFSA